MTVETPRNEAARDARTVTLTPVTTSGDPAENLSRQLAIAVRTDGGTTEIRLDPAELGRVRIALSTVDGTITMTIHADRPETLDLIRRNLDGLAQELRALGYQGVGFDMSSDGGASGRSRGETGDGYQTPVAPIAGEVIPDNRGATRPGNGLDLRL